MNSATKLCRAAARGAIRAYQLTFSALAGSQCRHLPTCSAYMDEAIARHGLWAGGFMGFARLCRCQPWGTAGFDPVPARPPDGADWRRPWRYGRWRGPLPQAWGGAAEGGEAEGGAAEIAAADAAAGALKPAGPTDADRRA